MAEADKKGNEAVATAPTDTTPQDIRDDATFEGITNPNSGIDAGTPENAPAATAPQQPAAPANNAAAPNAPAAEEAAPKAKDKQAPAAEEPEAGERKKSKFLTDEYQQMVYRKVWKVDEIDPEVLKSVEGLTYDNKKGIMTFQTAAGDINWGFDHRGNEYIGRRGFFNSMTQELADTQMTLARAHGWTAITVHGRESTKEMLWLSAQRQGITVNNFVPSKESEVYKIWQQESQEVVGIKNANEGDSPQNDANPPAPPANEAAAEEPAAPAAAEATAEEPAAPAAAEATAEEPAAPAAAEATAEEPAAPAAAEATAEEPAAPAAAEATVEEPAAPAAAEATVEEPAAPAAAEATVEEPAAPAAAEAAAEEPATPAAAEATAEEPAAPAAAEEPAAPAAAEATAEEPAAPAAAEATAEEPAAPVAAEATAEEPAAPEVAQAEPAKPAETPVVSKFGTVEATPPATDDPWENPPQDEPAAATEKPAGHDDPYSKESLAARGMVNPLPAGDATKHEAWEKKKESINRADYSGWEQDYRDAASVERLSQSAAEAKSPAHAEGITKLQDALKSGKIAISDSFDRLAISKIDTPAGYQQAADYFQKKAGGADLGLPKVEAPAEPQTSSQRAPRNKGNGLG